MLTMVPYRHRLLSCLERSRCKLEKPVDAKLATDEHFRREISVAKKKSLALLKNMQGEIEHMGNTSKKRNIVICIYN